jgi:methionine-R-sulfoxide reductase
MKSVMILFAALLSISCVSGESGQSSTSGIAQSPEKTGTALTDETAGAAANAVTAGKPSGLAGETATVPAENALAGLVKTLSGEELFVFDGKYADQVCYIEPTAELKARLSPEEWQVLVEAGTEPPFMNKYWNNHAVGVYFDAADGTPLFTSKSKFDSGTGWPSFWEPIDKNSIVLVEDRSYGMVRIEVRAKASGGHLGHLFDDGPQPTGLRYCINSAALRFVPLDELKEKGFGHLVALLTN